MTSMRDRTGLLLFAFPIIVLLLTLGVLAFPTDASAIGGICGGPVPCACGDVVVASRALVCGVDPITGAPPCGGNGLTINGFHPGTDPGIVLNLGGCTIRGQGGGGTHGVGILFYDGATVTSGKITGFGSGVFLDEASDTRVTRLQLTANVKVGIASDEGNFNLFESNVVSGMACGVAAIWVDGGVSTIRLNRAEYNAFDGTQPAAITVTGGLPGEPGANTVSRNVVHHNGICGAAPVAGIAVTDSTGTIELNRSDSNDGDGFLIGCSDLLEPGNAVARNIALRNAGNGFTVDVCGNQVVLNRSDYNGGYGIAEAPSLGPANTYQDNRCTGNALGKSWPSGLCR
jgi:hypothetical protein